MALLSEGSLRRLNYLINWAKTIFHWGFLPTILYLGFQKGNEPGMPTLTFGSLFFANLELTLAILKPDVTKVPYAVNVIRDMILDKGFLIPRSKKVNLSRADAEQFYIEHEGKFFHNRLVTFMSSGTSHVHILAKKDAIKDWRALMGPTKVMKTRYEHPDTIRGMFGLSDTRNCSHGSDSLETATREIKFFFPDFDIHEFNNNSSTIDSLKFDYDNFVHSLNS